MYKAIRELASIVTLAVLVGTPIGLYITGAVEPVAQWGEK
jgi:hypothetical protein